MSAAATAEARLGAEDLRQLEEQGISQQEALRQLRLLASPPAPRRLDRPCTVGDGIRRLEESELPALEARFMEAAAAGRAMKFVPASGAATRMFQRLLPYLDRPREAQRELLEKAAAGGDEAARDLLRFAANLERFAFRHRLRAAFRELDASLAGALHHGDLGLVIRVLLGPEGLDLGATPKALIPFHDAGGATRTAIEEHLVEGRDTLRDRQGLCRLHFTAAPAEEPRFERHVAEAVERLGAAWPAEAGPLRFEVGFSVQHPSTDTLALAEDGLPFRRADGSLLLRPGGHGALLRNLGELGADLLFIKNIDNVVPDRAKGPTILWKRVLGGYLVELQERVFELVRRLEAGEEAAVEEAAAFLAGELQVPASELPARGERRAFLLDQLDRPLRVCGVVPNAGEPGGGPFWVEGESGRIRRQIVETAQIGKDPGQQEVLAGATHFNPVDLVCGLRDHRGRPFDLERFADPATAFVAKKLHQGVPLAALERPGLWNGAMARWTTVFVEVPAETFAPVKTVFDLLRPEHQGE